MASRDGLAQPQGSVGLRGSITDTNGPVPNHVVDINLNGTFLDNATTDPSGYFDWRIGLLQSGFYAFEVASSPNQSVSVTFPPLYRTVARQVDSVAGAPETFCITDADPTATTGIANWISYADTNGLSWWQYILEWITFRDQVNASFRNGLLRKFGNKVAFTFAPNCSTLENRVLIEFWSIGTVAYSSPDRLNSRHNDEVHVSVNALTSWENMFDHPMKPRDLADDAGRSFATVVAHEVGHTVGLVLRELRASLGSDSTGTHIPVGGDPTSGLRDYRGSLMKPSLTVFERAEIATNSDSPLQRRRYGAECANDF